MGLERCGGKFRGGKAKGALLYLGDFGNESVKIVEDIKKVPFPKAVILGNHDAWHGFHFSKGQGFVNKGYALWLELVSKFFSLFPF